MTTMNALVLQKVGDISVETRPKPAPGTNEVLVRVRRVGVCGSDVHYYTHGRIGSFIVEKPIVLGHEMSGMIEAVGSNVTSRKVGERVAVEPGVPDRTCEFCRSGRYNLCPNMQFMATPPFDGALAEYIVTPADFAFPLPENVSLDEGALVEPLSVGVHAIYRSQLRAGEHVAILGAGPIGLVTLQVAKAAGAGSIFVIDVNEHRLNIAKSLGATDTIDATTTYPLDALRQRTRNRGVDVVYDCAGTPKTAGTAVHLVRRGGRVTMIGLPPEDNFPYPLVAAMAKEADIVTVFRYANVYPAAIALIAEKRVNVQSLITHRFSLDQGEAALQLSDKRADNVIKAMIEV